MAIEALGERPFNIPCVAPRALCQAKVYLDRVVTDCNLVSLVDTRRRACRAWSPASDEVVPQHALAQGFYSYSRHV